MSLPKLLEHEKEIPDYRTAEHQMELVQDSEGMTRHRGLDSLTSFFYDTNFHLKSRDRVLELGCGQGNAITAFAVNLCPAYAVDFQRFPGWNREQNVRFSQADIHALPFKNDSFRFVYSYWAFPYLHDKLQGLKEVHRVLQSGGMGVIYFIDLAYDEPGIRPSFPEILNASRANGQIHHDVQRDCDGNSYLKVFITKNSSEPLQFPKRLRTKYYKENLRSQCTYAEAFD